MKPVTDLTTADASDAMPATCAGDGFAAIALTSLASALTDVLMALVSLAKSSLAESTSFVALLWIVLSCDCSPLSPPENDRFERSLIELSRLARSAQ